MRIRVLYFAAVRERLRLDEEAWELDEGATVSSLMDRLGARHAAVARLRPHLMVARNLSAVGGDAVLVEGDEVALIPPVSGGAGAQRLAEVRDSDLSLDEAVRAVSHAGAGGVVTFCGAVRRQSRGREVERLEYEAYRPMAEAVMRRIIDGIEAEHAGVRVAILHRVGVLAIGELAVVIAASAPHRAEAFAATREAIERLKAEVPIWKKEVSTDGEEWIGLGP